MSILPNLRDPKYLLSTEGALPGYVLQVDGSNEAVWGLNIPAGMLTGVNNVGSGAGVFKDIVGSVINLRSLISNNNLLTIAQNTNDISFNVNQLNITGVGTLTQGIWNATTIAVNHGGTGLTGYSTGAMLYASGPTTLSSLLIGSENQVLKSISGIPTWADGGDVSTAENVGGGPGEVFKDLLGSILRFRTLNSSTKLSITTATDTVELDLAVANFAFNEIPSGDIDGINAIFTLSNTPNPSSLLMVYKAGLACLQGVDYILLTPTQIEFVAGNEPRVGDNLFVQYYY